MCLMLLSSMHGTMNLKYVFNAVIVDARNHEPEMC
jgi:hypothetical protein